MYLLEIFICVIIVHLSRGQDGKLVHIIVDWFGTLAQKLLLSTVVLSRLMQLQLSLHPVCTPFPALENGEVSQPSPIAVVSSASFSCNEGYDLQGANRRVCLSNGVWTGTDSSCTRMCN